MPQLDQARTDDLAPAPGAWSAAGLRQSLRALWPQPDETRDLALDGLRGLAVLLVVATHTASSIVPLGGMVGVTTFFVLSGYLITTLLARERDQTGRVAYAAFYARRALRLLPALVLLVAATPVLMWAVGDPGLGPQLVPASAIVLLYLSDFAFAAGNGLVIYGHTWSLSVEEQFYLLWPVLLVTLLGSGTTRRRAVRVVAALTAAAVLWRLVAAATLPLQHVEFSLDTSIFALLVGALLALLSPTPTARTARTLLLAGVAGLVVLAVVPLTVGSTPHSAVLAWGAPLAALLAALAVVGARHGDVLLSWAPLVFFGRISYGLNLWHEVLLVLRPDGVVLEGLVRIPVAGLSVLVAIASWALVEAPALRFKRRFERTRL